MTPKNLGVLCIALFALWTLIVVGGALLPGSVSEVAGVGIAQAGDPDQYTNCPQGPQGGESDTTKTSSTPPPTSTQDGGGSTSRNVTTLLRTASLIFWGSLLAI